MTGFGGMSSMGSMGSMGSMSGMSSMTSAEAPGGLEQLIPVINKLQDVFTTLGTNAGELPLDLPQICVVGSQSSGKSSVLEHIVGRDFLPRGSGIVTRRPLVLQLIQVRSGTSEEWGEFLHLPGQKFTDFNKIRTEISTETDRLTGKNKGISPHPMNLKIYSPHVLNLTLVDLPGLTRVPVGDQPVDIERQIREMIKMYAGKANALILAVTPANTDLATSDAIQLAREMDPAGERTLGVLTKLDIMDRGTNALDILNNQVVPLKLGYVGIVNRSQEDIAANVSIRDALKKEATFFANHPHYRSIAQRCGTGFLSKNLNRRLLAHIRSALPELRNQVALLTAQAQNEMAEYGTTLNMDDRNGQLLTIISKFSQEFNFAIDGKDVNTTEILGGARLISIFNDQFCRSLDSIDPLHGLSPSAIQTAIRNSTGTRTALFIPEESFEVLMKRQIEALEEPAFQCINQIYEELQALVAQIEFSELVRFKKLRDRILEVMDNLLQSLRAPTRRMVENVFHMELAYINTAHPDFIGKKVVGIPQGPAEGKEQSEPLQARPSSSSFQSPSPMREVPPSVLVANNNDSFTELIQKLIVSYFEIVRKNIKDLIPKSCMHFMVCDAKAKSYNTLVSQLYRPEEIGELLEEAPEIADKRKSCRLRLDALQRANDALIQVRDLPL